MPGEQLPVAKQHHRSITGFSNPLIKRPSLCLNEKYEELPLLSVGIILESQDLHLFNSKNKKFKVNG